jgi:site-specific recombinase XerC
LRIALGQYLIPAGEGDGDHDHNPRRCEGPQRDAAAVTSGKGFDQRRDHAIIRLFLDCGLRLSELAGLTIEDVDLDTHDVVHVVGKGSRGRAAVWGKGRHRP